MKSDMNNGWHLKDKPYPTWALSNNSAEIRRVKGRIASISAYKNAHYEGWAFEGGHVVANTEDNRLQVFFDEKPDADTRTALKSHGFLWSPNAGAWQRQLNNNALYAAKHLECLQPVSDDGISEGGPDVLEQEGGMQMLLTNIPLKTVALLPYFGYNKDKEVVHMSIDISDISLANDLVFGEVMRQPENVKPLLEAVLEKEIAEIVFIEKQQDIKDGLYLHGIRLDISLADADGTQYCVEMQVGRAYDLEKRIRFYQSSIDRRTLEAAETYRKLHESYVIFICTDDYYKRGLALYKRKSIIEGAEDLLYEDGSHAYILNANFKIPNMSEPALDFLRYIYARHRKLSVDVSDSDYLTKIDQAVKDLKSDKGRVERLMTLAAKLQDERWIGRQEGLEEGIEKGAYDTKVATAKRLLERKMSLEDIADISGLTISEVKKLAEDE